METTFYYSFSTVAQTLAGAIGLLAAFMIYYLAQLDRALRSHLEVLRSRYPSATETLDLDLLWTRYDVRGLLEYFSEDKLKQLDEGGGLDKPQFLAPAWALFHKRQMIASQMRLALWWTGGTILGSLVMLAVTRVVADAHQLWGVGFLGLGIVAVGICLALYGRIVIAALKEQ